MSAIHAVIQTSALVVAVFVIIWMCSESDSVTQRFSWRIVWIGFAVIFAAVGALIWSSVK